VIFQPALVASKVLLEQKISILSLIEEMFNKSTKQITFDQISHVTQLPKQEVEWLIMRALSLGLIRGSIDQVHEQVTISWVQPRTLSREQIGKMKERMTSWSSSVKDALLLMENQITPEMI
jgi:26S proteasome regulatory subunit N9